jgi:hypothetical protein
VAAILPPTHPHSTTTNKQTRIHMTSCLKQFLLSGECQVQIQGQAMTCFCTRAAAAAALDCCAHRWLVHILLLHGPVQTHVPSFCNCRQAGWDALPPPPTPPACIRTLQTFIQHNSIFELLISLSVLITCGCTLWTRAFKTSLEAMRRSTQSYVCPLACCVSLRNCALVGLI